MKKRNLVLATSILASLLVTACGGGDDSAVKYTYRDAMSASPDTWNVHTWKTSDDSVIFGYTEIGLYDFAMNSTKDGYDIVPEMASGDPVDSTSTLTDAEVEKYGLDVSSSGEKYTSGQKWVINLNESAVWQDGTAINADTYLDSMDRLLDPAMVNYRANSWYSGDVVLGNAEGRFKSGRVVYESLVGNAEDGSPDLAPSHSGTRDDEYVYGNAYQAPDYVGYSLYALYSGYLSADEAPKTAALLNDTDTWGTEAAPADVNLTTNTTAKAAYFEAWAEVLPQLFGLELTEGDRTAADDKLYEGDLVNGAFRNAEVDFSSVGIVKSGDYQLTLYLARPCTTFQLYLQLSSNWIVKTDIYDANKKTVGSLTSTTYGTSKDTYMSYGPYKLDSYTLDKEIILSKNEKRYGYKDGNHVNQFKTTDINIQIVASDDTILSMFEKGDIDGVSLRSKDMAKYQMSSRILYTPQTYTDKIALNSNFDKLKTRQDSANNSNKTILSNVNFRKFLSWALDRETFVQTQTPGSSVALGAINSMYVADVDTGTLYRNTEDGKRVISDVYGDSTTGYDLEKAKEYLNKAIEEEKASSKDGHYAAGNTVDLEWQIYNEGWQDAIDFVIDCWEDATAGTELEGKLNITTKIDTALQDNIMAGNTDICMDIWGGDQMNPYGIPDTWISAKNRTCYGFNPDNETIWIDLDGDGKGSEKADADFQKEVRTNTEWYNALNSGEYSSANAEYTVRTKILSYLEEYMLENQYFICQRSRQSVSLMGYKVENGCEDYIQLVGFGGIRFLTYNYNDTEWAEQVAKGLDYTK